MTKKRTNGEGTVFQRKDGRWVTAIWVKTSTHTWERQFKYSRSRSEAEDKLLKIQKKIANESPITPVSLTVGAYLEDWLDNVAAPRVRESTLKNYRYFVDSFLVPGLGGRRIGTLTARDIRLFLAAERKRGTGARSIQYIHATLRAALEDAVRDELIERNAARLVRVPRPVRRERRPLTVDEARALLKSARDDRLYAMFVVLVLLGMRRSEVLGLRWQDVDPELGFLQVRKTLHRQEGGLQLLPPKTQRSRRTIPLPAFVAAALRAHADRQAEEQTSTKDWRDTGFVFTTTIGTPIDPQNCSHMFAAQCKKAGVPVVPLHALRHTCVSLLLSMGAPPRVVMEIAGHSALEMTMNVYGHVDLGARRDALDKLADVFTDPDEGA